LATDKQNQKAAFDIRFDSNSRKIKDELYFYLNEGTASRMRF